MMRIGLVACLVVAGIAVAEAAPNIPSSELPGRERDRFLESPVDRFTQPGKKQSQPLWRWDCDPGRAKRAKRKGQKGKPC